MDAIPTHDLRSLLAEGRWSDAAALLRRQIVAAPPGGGRSWGLLALAERQLGRLDAAREAAARATELAPRLPAAWLERAEAEALLGQDAAARGALQRAAALPVQGGDLVRLARLLHASGLHTEALPRLRAALQLRPDDASLWRALLGASTAVGESAEARMAASQALAHAGGAAVDWMDHAFTCFSADRFEEGHAAVERALAQDPDFLPARWARFQLPLHPAPASDAEAAAYLRRWDAGVAEFAALDPEDAGVRAHVVGCIGQCTPFYRHYLDDALEASRRHGAMLGRLASGLGVPGQDGRVYGGPGPALWGVAGAGGDGASPGPGPGVAGAGADGASPGPGPGAAGAGADGASPGPGPGPGVAGAGERGGSAQAGGGRRRVAVVHPWMYAHTVDRLFGPMVAALDARRFEVEVFSLRQPDPASRARHEQAGQVVHVGDRPALAWAAAIESFAPDVVLYTEIGMDPTAQLLACLRLAPVQAMLWGHPVSTGLDTLDWALVPDLLEPDDAEDHYSERVLRLPGLGCAELPLPAEAVVAAATAARRGGGDPVAAAGTVSDNDNDANAGRNANANANVDIDGDGDGDGEGEGDSIELLCAQSVYKLLPAQDAVFARILAALPNARLHLIAHPDAAVRAWLRQRMAPVLQDHGVDPARLVVHPFLDHAGFLARVAASDLGLDGIGWSGGMSALDQFAVGLPVVTVEGPLMRQRQTAALARALDADALVARDADDYVDRVIALARDPQARADLSQRLRTGLPALWQDAADTHAAFAAFLAGSP